MNRFQKLLHERWGLFPDASLNGKAAVSPGTAASAHPAPSESKAASGIQFVGDERKIIQVFQFGPKLGDAEELYRRTAFVASVYCYRAILFRAEKLAEAPLFVAQEKRNEKGKVVEEWMPNHPLTPTLDNPSPDYDMGLLLRLTSIYRDTTGMALWVTDRNNAGRVGRITPFAADEFTIHDSPERIYDHFRISTSRGPLRRNAEDCVLFRFPHPNDWHQGLAPLDVALTWLNLGQQVKATVKSLLRNALMPGGIISADPSWSPTDEEFEEYKRAVEQYTRTENKGKPLVLLGGSKISSNAFNLRDLLPDEIMDRIEATVAAAFGIPAVVLGYLVGLRNSPWSQMQESRRQAYEDTIEPLWRADEKTLTRQLLTEEDRRARRFIRFDTSRVRALQKDQQQMALIAGSVQRWTSVNERREMLGLDPVDDPRADEIPELTQPLSFPSLLTRRAEDDDADDEDKAALVWPVRRKALTAAQMDAQWHAANMQMDAQQATWELVCIAQLNDDRDAVLALARRTLKPQAKASDADLETKAPPPFGPVDPATVLELIRRLSSELDLEGKWTGRVRPLVESTATASVQSLAATYGIAFDVLQPGILRYTATEAAWLVKEISDHTRAEIRAALQEGLKNGESVDDIARRIQKSGAFSRSRAELIARTETTRVTNGAGVESMSEYARSTGTAVHKTWLATRDNRTRDAHLAMDGETAGIDDVFSNGLSAPSQPNCRCTLLYTLEDAA